MGGGGGGCRKLETMGTVLDKEKSRRIPIPKRARQREGTNVQNL